MGSGALVAVSENYGLVVTNWHVVHEAAGQITVVFPDGFRSAGTVLGTDRDWDLAALAIRRPKVDPIPLATQPPRPGEPLTIAGYGSGWYRAVTGRCTQYVSPGHSQPFEMVELSAGARQGDSGGPILNSRGELAGVLFGSAFGNTTGSYCGRVRWFLASVADDFRRWEPDATMIAQRPSPSAANGNRPWQPSRTPAGPPPRLQASSVAESRTEGPGNAGAGKRAGPLPVAAIPAGPGTSPASSAPQSRPPSANGGWVASVPGPAQEAQSARPDGPEPHGWENVAGTTRGEQIKTILAAIGLFSLLFHAMRLVGGGAKS